MDASGRPHIIYEDYTNRNLCYATLSGFTWQNQVVDSDYGFGGTSMALNSRIIRKSPTLAAAAN